MSNCFHLSESIQMKEIKVTDSLTQIQFLTSSGPPPRTDGTDRWVCSLLMAIVQWET